MEGLMFKKTKEPPKKVNHKGNIKFLKPLLLREAYQIRKEPPKKVNRKRNIKFLKPLLLREAYQIRKGEDLLKGCLAYKNPHLLYQHVSKWRSSAHTVMPLTPFVYKMFATLREEGLQLPLLPTNLNTIA
jgi:hypothetical protein